MDDFESLEATLLVKELHLTVKFPCRVTLQHQGKVLGPDTASQPGSSIFPINQSVTVRGDTRKEMIEINVMLMTEKGGNIMAGLVRLSTLDLAKSQGEHMNVPLQKCLDPYATCSLTVSTARISKSPMKRSPFNEEKRHTSMRESKFQTKSQVAPTFEGAKEFKSRLKYNDNQTFLSKRVNFTNLPSPSGAYIKDKAFSTVGANRVRESGGSFDKEGMVSRFKHYGRTDQDNKTVMASRKRDVDQIIRSTMEANEQALKMDIAKYKARCEESERALEEKQRQIKSLKDQISELTRQMTQKMFLQEEISTKNAQISRLEESSKSLSHQLQMERNRVIDMERSRDEDQSVMETKLAKVREQADRKAYEMEKQLFAERQQVREKQEELQYKVNQIGKMRSLIEELERATDTKTIDFEKGLSFEKAQHSKTKLALKAKTEEMSQKLAEEASTINELRKTIKSKEETMEKLSQSNRHLQDGLSKTQTGLQKEVALKQKVIEEKKAGERYIEELKQKVEVLLKDNTSKEIHTQDLEEQLKEQINSNKRRSNQLLEKNKTISARVQQLQGKVATFTASEQKARRGLETAQRQIKAVQQNQRSLEKTVKLREERILQLSKQLSDSQNKNNLRESLARKDEEHKSVTIQRLNLKVSQLTALYQKQRDGNEEKRLQLMRNDSKIKILEDSGSRLHQQLKEAKQQTIRREEELSQHVKELEEEVRGLMSHQTELSKNIHSSQMEKINLRNELTRVERMLEAANERGDKHKRREEDLEGRLKEFTSQLEITRDCLIESESREKELENEYRLLQAAKNKNEKMNVIVSEEKDSIKLDVQRLKKEVEKKEQREEQQVQEIKALREEITMLELKQSSTQKEYEKFKNHLTHSITTALAHKHIFNDSSSRQLIKSKTGQSEADGEVKLAGIVESFAKEAHQQVVHTNEELKRAKKQKEWVEKELNTLESRFNDRQKEHQRAIKQHSLELESAINRGSDEVQRYEQRLSVLEQEISAKEETIKEFIRDLQNLTNANEYERQTHEANSTDWYSKVETLRMRISELEQKDEINANTFVTLEQKVMDLERVNMDLEVDLESYREELMKKGRALTLVLEEADDVKAELEMVKKSKSEQVMELLGLKEKLAVQKQNIERASAQVREEENKNKQLAKFNNDLLKEKEKLIKKELQAQQALWSAEQESQSVKHELNNIKQAHEKANKTVEGLREQVRSLQNQNSGLQVKLSDCAFTLERQRERIKDKDRRLNERQAESESNMQNHQKTISRLDAKIEDIERQRDEERAEWLAERQALSRKLTELEDQIRLTKQSERKQTESATVLEEQLFFERQNTSLVTSRVEELKHELSDLRVEVASLANENQLLADEIKEKEESLFALSGKLYSCDNKLESKQEQMRARITKLDNQWHYKMEEICEEYENKIEMLERDKSYQRVSAEETGNRTHQLQRDKAALRAEHERDKEAWEEKVRRMEEQKLLVVMEKNKEVESIRESKEELEFRLKSKEIQIRSAEEEKKKAEDRVREMKQELSKADDKRVQMLRSHEKELQVQKRKEGQLKRFKEALKNSQWTQERQIKKGIQTTSKTVAGLCSEESRGEVLQAMRGLESSIIKWALPNIDQI